MPVRISSGNGRCVASENDVFLCPRLYKGDGTVRGVIWCHGANQTASTALSPSNGSGLHNILMKVASEFPVVMTDLGGLQTWGNDTVVSRVASAKTWLQGTYGAKSGQILLIGCSMGNASALVYASQNLSSVAAAVGIIPVSDIGDIHDNNRWSFASYIDSAYGGSWVTAAQQAAHNPVYMASSTGGSKYAGLPYQAWYGDSDTVVIPSTVTTLVSNIGASAEAHTLSGEHADSTIAQIDTNTLMSFLRAHA